MKSLKFESKLVPLVLSGQKISTWRFFDDKNISIGDNILFIDRGSMKTFARAKVTKVLVKPVGSLTKVDKLGHEKFKSDKEMYETYSRYYRKEIGPDTPVKIIRFLLVAQS